MTNELPKKTTKAPVVCPACGGTRRVWACSGPGAWTDDCPECSAATVMNADQNPTTALWPVGQVEIKDCRVTYSVSSSELLLAINDIHLRALAARHGGDDGSIMLEIEQIAEDIIDRACNENASDTEFTTDE